MKKETILCGLMSLKLQYTGFKFVQENAPLVWYHVTGQKSIREKAEEQATYLKNEFLRKEESSGMQEVRSLLRKACKRIGEDENVDLTVFLQKLDHDWINNLDRLKGINDVDILREYMPRVLAQAVHEILQQDGKQASQGSDGH